MRPLSASRQRDLALLGRQRLGAVEDPVALRDLLAQVAHVRRDRAPDVAPQAGAQPDLARRLALEEARDRAERRIGGGEERALGAQVADQLAVALDAHHRAEVDLLEPAVARRLQVARGLQVGDVVAADLGGLADLQLDVARVLERRGGRHAGEQHRDPDVHEVAAVAAAVALDERDDRARHRVARHRAPRPHPAPQLLPDGANTNAASAEHQQRARPSRSPPRAPARRPSPRRRRPGGRGCGAGSRPWPGATRSPARCPTAARARATAGRCSGRTTAGRPTPRCPSPPRRSAGRTCPRRSRSRARPARGC